MCLVWASRAIKIGPSHSHYYAGHDLKFKIEMYFTQNCVNIEIVILLAHTFDFYTDVLFCANILKLANNFFLFIQMQGVL